MLAGTSAALTETPDNPAATVRRTASPVRGLQDPVFQKITQQPAVGKRVTLDVEPLDNALGGEDMSANSQSNMIKDIVEHETASVSFAEPDLAHPSASLRPKKIDWRAKTASARSQSRFLTSRQNLPRPVEPSLPADNLNDNIAKENAEKLASMSVEDIMAEKRQLTRSLDPGVLAALMRRSTKATKRQEPSNEFGPQFSSEFVGSVPQVQSAAKTLPARKSPDTDKAHQSTTRNEIRKEYTSIPESFQDDEIEHVHSNACLPSESAASTSHVHFASHPSSAELDPSSDTFLQDLKSKYFPHLDHDPSSLAWMRPPTVAEDTAEYHESLESLMPAQLRFDFQGNFLAPRTSREVDAAIGLHHHSDAPLAAGYTVPELARLCRSSYPSQACIAIQTIGRIMYKMGKKFYGDSISDKLKRLVQKSGVEQTLLERGRDRHMGISSYATEALWQANLGREGQTLEGM